jgi:hypothetical protein
MDALEAKSLGELRLFSLIYELAAPEHCPHQMQVVKMPERTK